MSIEYGSSRWNDPKGMLKLENHKPDERRIKLYSRVKRFCEVTAGYTARDAIEPTKDLNAWAVTHDYSRNEVKEMKVSIRR